MSVSGCPLCPTSSAISATASGTFCVNAQSLPSLNATAPTRLEFVATSQNSRVPWAGGRGRGYRFSSLRTLAAEFPTLSTMLCNRSRVIPRCLLQYLTSVSFSMEILLRSGAASFVVGFAMTTSKGKKLRKLSRCLELRSADQPRSAN